PRPPLAGGPPGSGDRPLRPRTGTFRLGSRSGALGSIQARTPGPVATSQAGEPPRCLWKSVNARNPRTPVRPPAREPAMSLQSAPRLASTESLKAWLIAWLASEQGVEREAIDPSQAFLSYGLDSVQAMSMIGDLEAALSRRLPPTLAWDYP